LPGLSLLKCVDCLSGLCEYPAWCLLNLDQIAFIANYFNIKQEKYSFYKYIILEVNASVLISIEVNDLKFYF